MIATVFLLVGYWALLTFVPVPGVGAGNYAEGKNLTNYIDRMWLPGHKYDGDHDPEGILSTLPAIATALLGILAGRWLTGPASTAAQGGGAAGRGRAPFARGMAVAFPVPGDQEDLELKLCDGGGWLECHLVGRLLLDGGWAWLEAVGRAVCLGGSESHRALSVLGAGILRHCHPASGGPVVPDAWSWADTGGEFWFGAAGGAISL